jgi:hypothetical protein
MMKLTLKLIPTATLAFMAQFDLKNATLKFVDGTAVTPKVLTLKIGMGNLTYTEHKKREYTLDRGKLSTVRNGDDTPIDVAIDFIWEFLKGNTTVLPTPEDILYQRGGGATWVSTDVDTCAPFAIDIQVFYAPCTTQMVEDIYLPDFRFEQLVMDAKAGMIKCTGRCNAITAVVARRTYTTLIVSP